MKHGDGEIHITWTEAGVSEDEDEYFMGIFFMYLVFIID